MADARGLRLKGTAGLADMPESRRKRPWKADFAGELTRDRLLRSSAVIGICKAPELDVSEPLACSRDPRIHGDNHVDAGVTCTRADGTGVNTEESSASDVMVSAGQVARHRTLELGFTGSFHDSARYVAPLADVIGVLDDMTGETGHPAPYPDRAVGYPEGQGLARHPAGPDREPRSTPSSGLRRRAGIASSASSLTPFGTSGRTRFGILAWDGTRNCAMGGRRPIRMIVIAVETCKDGNSVSKALTAPISSG